MVNKSSRNKIIGLGVFGFLGILGGFYILNRQNNSVAEGGAFNDVLININTKHVKSSYVSGKFERDYQFSIRMDENSPYEFEDTEENKRIVAESLTAKSYTPKFWLGKFVGDYTMSANDILFEDGAFVINVKDVAKRMYANESEILKRTTEIQMLAKENYDFSGLSVKIKEGATLEKLLDSYSWNHRIGAYQKGRGGTNRGSYAPRDIKLTPFNLSGLKIENPDICSGETVDLKKIFSNDVEATWVEEISASEIGEKSGKVHLKYNNGLVVSGDVELKVSVIKCEDDSKKDDDKIDDNPKDEPKTDNDSKEDPKTDGDDSGKTNKTDDDSKKEITPSEIKEDETSPKISAPDTGFAGNGGILGLIGAILLATSAATIYKIKK